MSKIAIQPDKPVLIAGPTASGKSALALEIAAKQGGVIVNADALQVFDGWRILTARPDDADLNQAQHHLYGHIAFDAPYSVGDWLRDVAQYLNGRRPIIVGGTGLYLSSLTEGLADIPATNDAVRATANSLSLEQLLTDLDAKTRSRVDVQNRARVQRAWEVLTQTGRPLSDWQDDPTEALLPLDQTTPILVDAPKDWLTPRIERRFDMMLEAGALAEAENMMPNWSPLHPSSKAIGAAELIAHLKGELSLDRARELSVITTRQYAKRQRTWFSKRMKNWQRISFETTEPSESLKFLD